MDKKSRSELEFENEVVDYLTKIGGVKQWEYEKSIKTTDQLWNNFKAILEANNRDKLDGPLTESEFKQVKNRISSLTTPYNAGQFLYGINGVSEIDIELENEETKFLTVFDQAQVGGGNTRYQVVNQIERPRIVDGKKDRRFDVTLLINGLPIIQMELKKYNRRSDEALNQMEQYIAERQFTDIFSTLQVLISMTPYDIKYMANTTLKQFNKAFSFMWQNETDASPVLSWKKFADKVLSIPMAHNLATRYMILDGTKNKESIKVMRPYQVYATKRALDKVSAYKFDGGDDNKLGYIWHTTGSGKTITSFKTSWLASRLANVDKVVFLVDRIALTNQTVDSYRAYDPVASFDGATGVISDTANTIELHRALTRKTDKNIIVTSIQKMSKYVNMDSFKDLDQNILFIVDEAHRSTGDGVTDSGMLMDIKNKIPTAAWLGYTGTPKFPETRIIFGDILHSYTIKEAISDKNVLGFNVQFKETIKAPKDASEEEYKKEIKSTIYDTSSKHVELVVKDILNNWNKRSADRRYNALLTVRVGGSKPSIPRAVEYFNKFIEENNKRDLKDRIKIGISFSSDNSNKDNMLSNNESLHSAIKIYNQMFDTAFDMTTIKEYKEDFTRRLNKTADDQNCLDLGIVVDQLLTGFDAPQLNTLYVDRTLVGANLIQAYSRTNRIHNPLHKPWGNIINYRWPEQNKKEMNKALAIYSNRDSSAEQQTIEELIEENKKSGILAKDTEEIEVDIKQVVNSLRKLSENFTRIPRSEKEQYEMYQKINEYNKLKSQHKQSISQNLEKEYYDVNKTHEEDFSLYYGVGINPEEEIILTTVLKDMLVDNIAKVENVDISDIDLEMVHISEVNIDYDYLTELIKKMFNHVKNNEEEKAKETKEKIDIEISKSDNIVEKHKLKEFVDEVYAGNIAIEKDDTMNSIREKMEKFDVDQNNRKINNFIKRWGIFNIIKTDELSDLIDKHKYKEQDLDKMGELSSLLRQSKDQYRDSADEDISQLSWIQYRNQFRLAIYELADEIKKDE